MQTKLESEQIPKFFFAGKSHFSIKSLKTNQHFTYRINKKKDCDIYFVSIAYNGGERRYRYIGIIKDNNKLIHTAKSLIKASSKSFQALQWALKNLNNDKLEIYHEGRCGRCGRMLTEPESIKSGFGDYCKNLMLKG